MKKKIGILLICILAAGTLSGCATRHVSNVVRDITESAIENRINKIEQTKETDGMPNLSNLEVAGDEWDVPSESEEKEELGIISGGDMSTLDTDYSKVKWGTSYTVPGAEGINISVTYCMSDINTLVVGVTNMYNQPVSVYMEGEALSENGQGVGNTVFYADALGSANTVVTTIYCSEPSDGRISWNNISVNLSDGTYVPWEADWAINRGDDGAIVLEYGINGYDKMTMGTIYGLILDQNGYVLDVNFDMNYDTINAGETAYGNLSYWGLDDYVSDIRGAAMFINPVK